MFGNHSAQQLDNQVSLFFVESLDGLEALNISIGVINQINKLAQQGGGNISVPDLLKVLNFPADVSKRINDARGDVLLQCPNPNEGGFSNTGNEINVDCNI